jgi:hypothetical protein
VPAGAFQDTTVASKVGSEMVVGKAGNFVIQHGGATNEMDAKSEDC